MVELLEVTEFMDDEIVCELGCELGDTVVEVEVAVARATPPSSLLIFNKDFVICEVVVRIVVLESRMDEGAGTFSLCFGYGFEFLASDGAHDTTPSHHWSESEQFQYFIEWIHETLS